MLQEKRKMLGIKLPPDNESRKRCQPNVKSVVIKPKKTMFACLLMCLAMPTNAAVRTAGTNVIWRRNNNPVTQGFK